MARLIHSPIDENIPTLSLGRIYTGGIPLSTAGKGKLNILPFFGDVFVGSAGSALGATIFTAALADCGLAKKAMVACGV